MVYDSNHLCIITCHDVTCILLLLCSSSVHCVIFTQCVSKKKNPDSIQISQNRKGIIILTSWNWIIILLICIWSLATALYSAINFIKHVKITFVQVLSLTICSLRCMIFIDICKIFDNQEKMCALCIVKIYMTKEFQWKIH